MVLETAGGCWHHQLKRCSAADAGCNEARSWFCSQKMCSPFGTALDHLSKFKSQLSAYGTSVNETWMYFDSF